MLDARILHSLAQLLHQYVNDGELKAGSKVFLVVFHEVRVFLHPFLQRIKE